MPLVSTPETQDNLDVEVNLLKNVSVASGQVLVRGEVVEQVSIFDIAAGVVTGTGDGVVSGETVADTAAVGTYTAVLIAAAANAGTFAVYAPDGARLADATVGVAYSSQIGFTIADGANDFIVGDTVTFAVTKSATPQVSSFTTGGVPYSVMYDAVDATAGIVVGKAYREAIIKSTEIDFGTGTDAEVRDALDMRNIKIVD